MKAPQDIIATLKQYSSEAQTVIGYMGKYDYRQEANTWNEYESNPILLEPEHPTLHGLYNRLVRYIKANPDIDDNIDADNRLSRANLEEFINHLEVSQETNLAAAFNVIPIEPLCEVSNKFKELNLLTESRLLNVIYTFAHGVRKWHKASQNNHGTIININIELNYDEATPEELAADAGFKIFSDLFKSTCHYTSKTKRTLYNSLKKLYSTIDEKAADKTVMATILLFRSKTIYRTPFSDEGYMNCKRKAFESLGRDSNNVSNYTEDSLTSAPKLGRAHVNRAETLIKEALENSR